MADFRDPASLVRENVPSQALDDFASGIVEIYGVKGKHQIFPDPQMHDAWPIMRRGLIEAKFAKIASAYPALKFSNRKNPAGTSYYVRIDVGPVVIVESKVESPDDIPRPAVHREELAQYNVTYLPGMEDLAPPTSPDAKLCAMIIHGPDPMETDRPAFIDMVFPTPDGKGYLGERLHLLPPIDEPRSAPSSEEEKVEDDLEIGFRDDIEREDKA
jgi:hypothetical protein